MMTVILLVVFVFVVYIVVFNICFYFVMLDGKSILREKDVDLMRYDIFESNQSSTYIFGHLVNQGAIFRLSSALLVFKYYCSRGGVVIKGSKLCKRIDQRFKELENDTN